MEFVSDGCRQICGYEREDFEQGRIMWGTLIHPDDRERIWDTTQNSIAANRAFEYEYRIATRANTERWVWERGRRTGMASGAETCLEGFISDITERKRTENELKDARAFSDAVLETAAEAVITIDSDGRIETFNGAAQKIFGYQAHEILGKNINVLMPDPYHAEHDRYIQRYLDTNQANIIGIGREVPARRKDGSNFPIHLSVSEVSTRSQRKFVGLIRDVSEQRAAERAAREHLEQLAHVDRLNMLGEMATGMAHEINQPLTAISLFSQAGKRLLDAGHIDRLPEIFDKLSLHAERAGSIIERMQTMARRGERAHELTDCNEMLAEVAHLAEAEARIREIAIRLEPADALPPVEIDTVQIQQVALNLLRNGMEAMRAIDCAGGNTITLATGRRADGDIEVCVIDTGCGVSEEIADKLFTPFSTTKDTGMGMGLSLSRTIIMAHGGQLSFRNNDTGGTTFFFTLPVAA